MRRAGSSVWRAQRAEPAELDRLTGLELMALCFEHGLAKTGVRAELVARLAARLRDEVPWKKTPKNDGEFPMKKKRQNEGEVLSKKKRKIQVRTTWRTTRVRAGGRTHRGLVRTNSQ
jgi:hypothetical protein